MKTKPVAILRDAAILCSIGWALGGCPSDVDSAETDVAMTTSGDTSSDTSNPEASDVTGSDASGQVDDAGSSGDAGGFIENPDVMGDDVPCDIWAQNCAEGEKCTAWATNDDDYCDAVKCSPIARNPGQPGDPCSPADAACTGMDDCDIASMCWNGTCLAFCSGSPDNPVCEDPSKTCIIANNDVLILCLPSCDPLLQDCADGEGCYPFADAFNCANVYESGAYGELCEFINVCNPGLFCAAAELIPGCGNKIGCCGSFCDLDDPDASMSCPGAAGGEECVPWYIENQAPPGLEHVGFCAIPAE